MDGTIIFRLTQKLDNVNMNAKEWAKRSFGDLFKIKGEVEEELKWLQASMIV